MQKARRAVSPPLLYIILFLQFPEIDLARLLVQLQIAVIPGLFNLPIFKGFALFGGSSHQTGTDR